jgi:hypothetical protein
MANTRCVATGASSPAFVLARASVGHDVVTACVPDSCWSSRLLRNYSNTHCSSDGRRTSPAIGPVFPVLPMSLRDVCHQHVLSRQLMHQVFDRFVQQPPSRAAATQAMNSTPRLSGVQRSLCLPGLREVSGPASIVSTAVRAAEGEVVNLRHNSVTARRRAVAPRERGRHARALVVVPSIGE